MKKGKTCRSEQIFQSIQQGPLRPLLFFERGSYMYRPIVFIDMPAFMKAYQAIQKLKKPSAVSNRLFQSLKLEDQIYDEAVSYTHLTINPYVGGRRAGRPFRHSSTA